MLTLLLKATPKAALALKSGRILTPSQDSLCGMALQPRETYVITGNYRITTLTQRNDAQISDLIKPKETLQDK